MLILVPIFAVLCSTGLFFILGRPRFLTHSEEGTNPADISIIIPARNEEHNIGNLLESIQSQKQSPGKIIVVDDDSSDRTAEVATSHGAQVVKAEPQPGGWKGKTWACQQGAETARGKWLLFLDADTRFEAGGMERIAALSNDMERVISICPYHQIRRPYEELSAFFNIIMIAGINSFGMQRDPTHQSALFGQCLLIPREIYQKVGGHESVRREILENFSLARHLEALGIPRHNFLGRGCINMRMFPGGLGELWSSWRKGFTHGAQNTAPPVLLFSSLWLTGGMLAIIGAALALSPVATLPLQVAAASAYLFFALLCLRFFRIAGNYSFLNALLFPISLLFYQTLFLTAVIERQLGIKSKWKGRHVD